MPREKERKIVLNIRIMNDVAFHFVFGKENRKYNLLNLLNAILVKDDQNKIQDLILQETKLDPETVGLKSCRLDIRALTVENCHINIEVQLLNRLIWKNAPYIIGVNSILTN